MAFGVVPPLTCMTLLIVFMVLGVLQVIVVIWRANKGMPNNSDDLSLPYFD